MSEDEDTPDHPAEEKEGGAAGGAQRKMKKKGGSTSPSLSMKGDLKDYDLDRVIRDCWWLKIGGITQNLEAFMMQKAVFLQQYLDEFESIMERVAEAKLAKPKEDKVAPPKMESAVDGGDSKQDEAAKEVANAGGWDVGDINEYAHFDHNAFSDCFDGRILCYLLTVHNKVLFTSSVESASSKSGSKKKR